MYYCPFFVQPWSRSQNINFGELRATRLFWTGLGASGGRQPAILFLRAGQEDYGDILPAPCCPARRWAACRHPHPYGLEAWVSRLYRHVQLIHGACLVLPGPLALGFFFCLFLTPPWEARLSNESGGTW